MRELRRQCLEPRTKLIQLPAVHGSAVAKVKTIDRRRCRSAGPGRGGCRTRTSCLRISASKASFSARLRTGGTSCDRLAVGGRRLRLSRRRTALTVCGGDRRRARLRRVRPSRSVGSAGLTQAVPRATAAGVRWPGRRDGATLRPGTGAAGRLRTAGRRRCPPPSLDQIRERHQLAEVNPLHQRHLEVMARLRRVADVVFGLREQVERAHQIFAREVPPAP